MWFALRISLAFWVTYTVIPIARARTEDVEAVENIEKGAWVWVAADRAELKQGERCVAVLRRGEMLKVLEVREGFVGVEQYMWGKVARLGWVNRKLVTGPEHAFEYFTALVQQRPSDSAAYYGLAMARRFSIPEISRFHSVEMRRSCQDLTRAIENRKGFWEGHAERGLIRAHFDQLEQAAEDFGAVIRYGPLAAWPFRQRADCYFRLAEFRTRSGELDTERELYWRVVCDYTQAIRLESNNPTDYVGRAKAYLRLSRYDAALADLQRAQRINPQLATAELAEQAWIGKGQYDKAMARRPARRRLRRRAPRR